MSSAALISESESIWSYWKYLCILLGCPVYTSGKIRTVVPLREVGYFLSLNGRHVCVFKIFFPSHSNMLHFFVHLSNLNQSNLVTIFPGCCFHCLQGPAFDCYKRIYAINHASLTSCWRRLVLTRLNSISFPVLPC